MSAKGQIKNILVFGVPVISVAMTHHCCCRAKAAIGRRHRPKRMRNDVPIKLPFPKQAAGQIWPVSPSSTILEMSAKIALCLFFNFHVFQFSFISCLWWTWRGIPGPHAPDLHYPGPRQGMWPADHSGGHLPQDSPSCTEIPTCPKH